MRVWIRRRLWTITDAPISDYGDCDGSKRLVRIQAGQPDRDRLDTLIHETLHALYPKMSERQIFDEAAVLSKVIWKDGWRRQNER